MQAIVSFAASLLGWVAATGSEVSILFCGMCANDRDDAELERGIIACIRLEGRRHGPG